MKTDVVENIGKHAFEVAGLGLAPFRFVGMSENVINYPDGSSKAGGSCAFCETGIRFECGVRSADGKLFVVGCDCIRKVNDAGLLKAYKSSPEFRKHQAQLRAAKAQAVFVELDAFIQANSERLAALPHPGGFVDRQSGKPLSFLDWANWMKNACGAKGRAQVLARLKRDLA